MARNYTQATIKTLFGEASACAYPGCTASLIFRDRGKLTVVAEIAHIRSETPGGPRHDPDYAGDVNGHENLLLLCGKHHRPVDRHESAYPIAELESWKAAQRASAGAGTPLDESDLRSFRRLTDEERHALRDVARLSQRVTTVCRSAQQDIDAVRHESEQARLRAARMFHPMYAVDDQGNRTLMGTDGFSLSRVEQREWDARVAAAWAARAPRAEEALGALDEELAVLRMFAGTLAEAAERVRLAAAGVKQQVGDGPSLDMSVHELDASVSYLWQLANGDIDEAERPSEPEARSEA